MSLVVPDHEAGRCCAGCWCLITELAWAVVGLLMVVLDRGMGWEVSQRVLGCRWWWSEGVLPVICDCVGGVFVGGG